MKASAVRLKLQPFHDWLHDRGASVLAPTNEWEVFRFMTDFGVGVAYTNKRGDISFVGRAHEAWQAFVHNGKFECVDKAGARKKAGPIVRALRLRDGDLCFFCRFIVQDEDATHEHLVPHSHGGPNHMSNYVLAHALCNHRAGNMPLMEKIKTHVENELKRLQSTAVAPKAVVPLIGGDHEDHPLSDCN